MVFGLLGVRSAAFTEVSPGSCRKTARRARRQGRLRRLIPIQSCTWRPRRLAAGRFSKWDVANPKAKGSREGGRVSLRVKKDHEGPASAAAFDLVCSIVG